MKRFLKAYSPHDKHNYFINIEQIVSVLDTDEHDVTVFMTDGKEYCLLGVDKPEDLNFISVEP